MLGAVLGKGDTALNETKIPALLGLAFRGKQANKINLEVNDIILDSNECHE